MRVVLYLSTNRREQGMRDPLVKGFKKHNVEVTARLRSDFWSDNIQDDADMVAFVGVKSRKMWNACIEKGKRTLIIDKGYFGRGDYYRISVDGYQPPYLAQMEYNSVRAEKIGVRLHPRREGGKYVLYAGSSRKYCMFHQIENVNDYAVHVCAELNKHLAGSKRVIYRPKPSWWANDDEEKKIIPPDTRFSGPDEHFSTLLRDCHCVVTHGSNAAVEALAAGVPVLLTSEEGISAVWSLADSNMDNIANPFWPTDRNREKLLSNLAWCQYSVDEIESGFAWEVIKQWVPT